MRVVAAWILALGLVAAPVMAGTNEKDTTAEKANVSKDAKPADKDTTKPKVAEAPADTAASASPAKAEAPRMEVELQQLRELLEMQAKQLQEQNEQLKQQQQRMELLEKQLNANSANGGTNNGTNNAAAVNATPATGVASGSSSSAASPAAPSPEAITAGITNTSKNGNSASAQPKPDEPAALHFKGITLTPGGFMAAETVWRSKALSADVNTPFQSVPMPGSSNSNITEFNASGRQSRISMLAEGKLSNVKIGGYYEADFLGGGSTSNNNQSNSYVLRQRQFWAQAAFDSGFKVTGGQMWSLITQTAKGMDNRTELLPMTIDAQYHIGFSWARQYGVRFIQDFGDKFWLGFSIEGPQTTFTVHGNPTATVTTGATTVTCPVSTTCPTGTTTVGGTSTTYVNFLLGASGTSGGLYNPLANYSYNPSPDLVFKAVAEPVPWAHFEAFGVYERFRDRVFPCQTLSATAICSITGLKGPSAAGAFNDSRNGGGGGANMMLNLFAKHLDLGVHFFGGSGIGRYGSAASLPDATIRPDGTIALLRNYQGLGTLILHPTPKLDIYMNGGAEFSARAAYLKAGATKANEGYGAIGFSNAGCYTEVGPTTSTPAGTTAGQGYIPGGLANCTADTRVLIEGTLGFWYRFYQGSRGRLQYGMQYSYYTRNTWGGTPPSSGPGVGDPSPHGVENMVFTSLRYYIP